MADQFAKLRVSEPQRPDFARDPVAPMRRRRPGERHRLLAGRDDAAEVDWFISVGESPPQFSHSREVQQQWVQFWGAATWAG